MNPGRKAPTPRRLAACLPEQLRAALSRRTDQDFRLNQAWRARVPEPLASHARPIRYDGGVLHVHVQASAWASRLRHQQPALVSRLRSDPMFDGLAQIRVRVVPPETALSAPATASVQPSRLSVKAAETVARTAATISHPGLRAALERLAAIAGAAVSPKRSR